MKTISCEFLDKKNKNGSISIKPLGKAKNSINKPMLAGWKNVVTDIKPYTPRYDKAEGASVPKWVKQLVF